MTASRSGIVAVPLLVGIHLLKHCPLLSLVGDADLVNPTDSVCLPCRLSVGHFGFASRSSRFFQFTAECCEIRTLSPITDLLGV